MASSAPTAVLSNVVGYFNPNSWPVVINISAVNVNFTLPSKAFVVLRDGRKVNDPILETYVGPDMLAKQTTKEGVPQVLFPRPDAVVVSHETGIRASQTVVKDSRGIVQDASFGAAAVAPSAPSSGGAIRVYSKNDAIKAGIIRPMIESRIEPPKETDGQPARLDDVPVIEDTTPREASPAEARRIIENMKKSSPSAPPPLAPEAPAGSDQAAQSQAEALFTAEEIKAKSEALLKSIEPKKTEFLCKADGKTFPRKSRLLDHVKKHYPDRVDELMAGY